MKKRIEDKPFKISVSICSYNRLRFILKTLDSLVNQDFPKDDFEILVVDNNSKEDIIAAVTDFSSQHPDYHIRAITEYNQGVAFARSRGADEAKGEIVAYIDDDCIAKPGWLKSINLFFDSNIEVFSIGGKITPYYLTEIPKWYSKYFFGLVGEFNLGNKAKRMTGAKYPCGANMAFRSEVFETIGLFNHALGRSGTGLVATEEKDIYKRILAQGWQVSYLPHVEVLHAVEMNKFDADYVRRHSMGIGAGERIRLRGKPSALAVKLLEYIAKLCYAVLYGIGFIFQGQFSKFKMLSAFRWWVIEGFLFPHKAK